MTILASSMNARSVDAMRAQTVNEPYLARRSPHADVAPFIWARQIRSAVDAVTNDPHPRALLVGNAGSGKSASLRHLHALLTQRDSDVVEITANTKDISRLSPTHVLLVDDLDQFSDAQLTQIRARAEDPTAALIVALRPSVWNEQVAAIAHTLEQRSPAVLLGHLSRSDILAYLENRDLFLRPGCLTHVLDSTAGVSWLVSAALGAHDDRDCQDESDHRELDGMLHERVAHRLDMVDPMLRRSIEQICIATPGRPLPGAEPESRDAIAGGYAEGLLLRNGLPVPLVRATVHATIPIARLLELSGELTYAAAVSGTGHHEWVGLLHDAPLGDALVHHADRILHSDPARAAELYEGAVQSGIDDASLSGRRAQAAWGTGDLRSASALIEDIPSGQSDEHTVDTAAAVWAARGMLDQTFATYVAVPPLHASSATRAFIAGAGIGVLDACTRAEDADDDAAPSALGVSMSLLRRGLAASLADDRGEGVLPDLVRASEMYTSSRTSAGIPELPAVLAAIVALNLGGLATAAAVIDTALEGMQGGPWAKPRLLLWRAWICVQRARPAEARAALDDARTAVHPLSPRDVLLAQAVEVAIARRYDDAAGLESAWRQARGTLLRVDVDLYLLHPLAELISSASRMGDTERIQPQFQRALAITEALGSPALWSAHLRWAGIQNGILHGTAETIRPHAKALVEASAGSRVAATMAKAGRVWTSVLGGTVDADAVEKAAHGLASIGLSWDAARLASHGAARADDRKISARLLACARELHPVEGSRKAVTATETDDRSGTNAAGEEVLSEREMEVARLVVEGKTYAEIGETIFISPRTAEHHIAHIRRRLGATSRSEVLAKLRQLLGVQSGSAGSAPAHPSGAAGTP